MAADQFTLDKIKLFHPEHRDELLEEYLHVNSKILGKGVRLRFPYTYRTPEEQHKLYVQRPKVTNADSWQSIHNYALAFDIVLLYDLDSNGTFETASWDMRKDFDKDKIADWMEVTNYFKSKGWEWGGDWKTFPDAPHFQKAHGLTWKKMKIKIESGHFTTEDFPGQKIKYINL